MATDDDQQRDGAPVDPPPERREPDPPPRQVVGYRTPRYPVFLATGGVLGLLTGLGLAVFGGASTATGGGGVLGYFAAFGTLIGLLVAGSLAVAVESLLNRGRRGRARRRPRGNRPS